MRTETGSARGCAVTEALSEQAMAWGYPRQITPFEINDGTWFTSELGILWFTAPVPPGFAPVADFDVAGVLVIHGIGDPKRRVQALSPETARLIERLGGELGAKKLYVSDGPGAPSCMPGIKRYLRRYGWVEDRWGAYKVLGGWD